METITSGVASVMEIAGDCVTFLTGNALCLIFIGASLVPIGFKIFKRAKNAAK